jgi:hypothetical protein
MTDPDTVVCTQGWEALRGDSLGWLLDPERPNLHWRVLVELVGRPVDSPAVRRARGGANACEPVSTLLADLMPDGEWATEDPLWKPHSGPLWRLIAAVQWGADPEDPRSHAASERILETAPGEGGLSRSSKAEPDPQLTARALEAMVVLGWGKHPRVQEWLAWFEATTEWRSEALICVSVLRSAEEREAIREPAIDGLGNALKGGGDALDRLGHPNLNETDLAEIFSVMASAGVAWRQEWRAALQRLQGMQDAKGRWSPEESEVSRWVTLKATRALLTYAVDAELERVFPYPPHLSP